MKKYSGVLLICEPTGNFLLLERGPTAHFSGTWAVVAGGVEEGETSLEAIKRELAEETGIVDTPIEYRFIETQTNIGDHFDFYIGKCKEEYMVELLDGENTDWGWFNMENLPSPLFPGLWASLLKKF